MNDFSLSPKDATYLVTTINEGVVTICMNRPKKLNGWTLDMIMAIKAAIEAAANNEAVKAIVLTGEGDYYSAGVNLSSTIKLMHPRKLRDMIRDMNQQLFEIFLLCPKPILVAFNGPGIGASVTTATLCNGIIAADTATFSLPFSALGVTPEGCSSVHLARLMGEQNARRMLGEEGWKPSAKEAYESGLVQWLVTRNNLRDEAHNIAKSWVEKNEPRQFMAGSQREELLEVNKRESIDLANAFLATKFLHGQAKFLWKKGKYGPALMFYTLLVLRPVWALTLR
ncbi:enoyl-CoA hydratase/isomerase family protein [Aestuariibacter salexigens]|uniref:enoyl-CoA hydratase/isomerase family protein n=1 Tax=Aestuariibacter salexigens TaxID=226010 RepID=UPI0004206F62|nr:enoyl-CoA hydratase/isomerase family protein [Aestuariibacter salexigens]